MVKYHPDARFLTDFSAGTLPRPQALCVSAHLHYCATCRTRIRELTQLGSELFLMQHPAAPSASAFDRLMGKIEVLPPGKEKPAPASPAAADPGPKSDLPKAVAKLARGNLDNLSWRSIGRYFRYTNLPVKDPQRETSLLHIKAGGSVPHHKHSGEEITVILKGSFSDSEDNYRIGDFIVRTPGETHRPVATQNEDCLCLVSLDAPIVMSNWLLRLLAPLFNRPHYG
jgi:putative transcriptional regulator